MEGFWCNSLNSDFFFQTSVFSASTEDQQYRQLYHPSEDYRSTEDPSVFIGNNVGASGAIKRSASYLDPIREEGASANSTQQQTPSDKSDTPPRGKFYIWAVATVLLILDQFSSNCM